MLLKKYIWYHLPLGHKIWNNEHSPAVLDKWTLKPSHTHLYQYLNSESVIKTQSVKQTGFISHLSWSASFLKCIVRIYCSLNNLTFSGKINILWKYPFVSWKFRTMQKVALVDEERILSLFWTLKWLEIQKVGLCNRLWFGKFYS